MDILCINKTERDERLKVFQLKASLFTEILNSTCSVEGKYEGVEFHEIDFTEILEPFGTVVRIKSNYGDIVNPDYAEEPVVKSNRGRKKVEKPKKNRVMQGNGSNMNSCIQFVVINKMSKHVKKRYKIKVFRNGKIQIPGVLDEDLGDVMQPLEDLCAYLDRYLVTRVSLHPIHSTMRNYKFNLIAGKLDVRAICKYCMTKFTTLDNINLDDLIGFVLRPIFMGGEYHPYDSSWKETLDMLADTGGMDEFDRREWFEINVDELIGAVLYSSSSNKSVLIDVVRLREWLASNSFSNIYSRYIKYMKYLTDMFIDLSERSYIQILKVLMGRQLHAMRARILKHSDNDLAGIKLDTEKYSGLLIYIKTPNALKTEKLTTIKIFPSGKINIDGANNIDEARFIYWWLNDLLLQNPKFVKSIDYVHDTTDSEFSESE